MMPTTTRCAAEILAGLTPPELFRSSVEISRPPDGEEYLTEAGRALVQRWIEDMAVAVTAPPKAAEILVDLCYPESNGEEHLTGAGRAKVLEWLEDMAVAVTGGFTVPDSLDFLLPTDPNDERRF